MTHADQIRSPGAGAPESRDAREWVAVLARYREPSPWRSSWEIAVTAGPFAGLWALAWWSVDFSYALAALLAVLNALFLVRLFMIQHDCGHAAFFQSRTISDWTGRVIGVLTLTPYDVGDGPCAHHSDRKPGAARQLGDVKFGRTMTVAVSRRCAPSDASDTASISATPFALFERGAFYLIFLQNRLPARLMRGGMPDIGSCDGNQRPRSRHSFLGIGLLAASNDCPRVSAHMLGQPASIGGLALLVSAPVRGDELDHESDLASLAERRTLHGSSALTSCRDRCGWLTANIGIDPIHHTSGPRRAVLPSAGRFLCATIPRLADAQRLGSWY